MVSATVIEDHAIAKRRSCLKNFLRCAPGYAGSKAGMES
jgi:hypothetical protein